MRILLPVSLLVLPLVATVAAESQHDAVRIDSRLELFADRFLIQAMDGDAGHRVHQPVPHEVAITTDRPWEGNTCAYYTVFQDGEIYRMYYRGSHFDERTGKSAHREVTCYAESRNGIDWTKPELGLIDWEGSKANNIVFEGPGSHCMVVFRDDRPGVPAEARYKGISRGNPKGLYVFQSPDGLAWTRIQEQPVITNGAFDSQNLAFWDPVRREYRAYWRYFGNGVRSIRTSSSSDFIHWGPDSDLQYGDAPVEHLYTNAIRRYPRAPHIFVGFPTRYQPKNSQVEPVFMISRDGVNFKRHSEPLIPITAPRDRDGNRSNYMANGLIQVAGNRRDYSVFGSEAYYTGPDSRLRRFSFRVDGFVSVSAGEKGGTVVTKPLIFSGSNLYLNYAAGAAGSVAVRLQEIGSEKSLQARLTGDEIAARVDWSSKENLDRFVGRPVVLTFALKNASLYSMQFRK